MKNVFLVLIFILIGSLSFALTNVESRLEMNSENDTELLSGNFIVETLTIDLGFFGCTSYVTVIDKDTKQVLAEFQYYDEECEGDSQIEYWYV